MSSLARADSGMVSVGLKAVELVTDTYRWSTRLGTQSELMLAPSATSCTASSFSSWEKRKSAGGQPS
ncbi:hypothetical protein ABT052_22730 [Streptomyces sp. NPDC002766]|jgi:hypothetical protein|uniref:hypothetical protein n=1 Tax=Streptomyces sp. NPDC002766 TaxID=3154429 RepID=UPI003324F100